MNYTYLSTLILTAGISTPMKWEKNKVVNKISGKVILGFLEDSFAER